MVILSAVWFTAAIGGVIAAVLAVATETRRQSLLMVAGGCFAIAGILGILSIGLMFLIAAAACFARATTTGGSTPVDGPAVQQPGE
ncbi:MAG: hypothetical protein WBP59_00370 [Ilumatobacteraceae bacterium]